MSVCGTIPCNLWTSGTEHTQATSPVRYPPPPCISHQPTFRLTITLSSSTERECFLLKRVHVGHRKSRDAIQAYTNDVMMTLPVLCLGLDRHGRFPMGPSARVGAVRCGGTADVCTRAGGYCLFPKPLRWGGVWRLDG